jgi:Tol biopolymer transport system component
MRAAAMLTACLICTGCPGRNAVECSDDTDCNVDAEGRCELYEGGQRWCSYASDSCESGRRWGDQSTGDGIGGGCQAASQVPDAMTAPDAPPPRNCGGVVFVATRDGNREIYRMDPDGSRQTRLTADAADDWAPVWSPTGEHVAFASKRSGNVDVWVMDADGQGLVNVSAAPGTDDSPAWSADGRKLAFVSDRNAVKQIFTVAPDGSGLSPATDQRAEAVDPSWGPGPELAYCSTGTLFVKTAAGLLTASGPIASPACRRPRWSPNARRLLWTRESAGDMGEVHAVDVPKPAEHDQNRVNLSQSQTSVDADPAWSADGMQVFFRTSRFGGSRIVRVSSTDGSGVALVSSSKGLEELGPHLSPDGTSLLFEGRAAGGSDLYGVALAGGTPTNLTQSPGDDAEPDWRACSRTP